MSKSRGCDCVQVQWNNSRLVAVMSHFPILLQHKHHKANGLILLSGHTIIMSVHGTQLLLRSLRSPLGCCSSQTGKCRVLTALGSILRSVWFTCGFNLWEREGEKREAQTQTVSQVCNFLNQQNNNKTKQKRISGCMSIYPTINSLNLVFLSGS